ncbi:MAG: BlaI/MecI/CopY family transcriptional regulator [Bacteroidota bacterium]
MNKPTDSELGILQLLWANGPQTVREVNDRLNATTEKSSGYTTTLKFMQIMLNKGLVSCDKSRRTHVYAAAVPEEKVQLNLLNRMTDMAFRGSAAQLVLRALGDADTSADELAAIKALIEQKEKEQY